MISQYFEWATKYFGEGSITNAEAVLSMGLGAIVGAAVGFQLAGVGGAIVGLVPGYLAGAWLWLGVRAVLGLVFILVVPLAVAGGLIAGVLWAIASVWNVGKPG